MVDVATTSQHKLKCAMTQNKRRVLINTPSLHLHGGVAMYYNSLKSILADKTVLCAVGGRGEKNLFMSLLRLTSDYLFFLVKIVMEKYDVIIMNPSMKKKSIVRDGIYIIIAKLLRKRVIVFFHGWDESYFDGLREYKGLIFRRIYGSVDAIIVLAKQFEIALEAAGIAVPTYVETTIVDDVFITKKKLLLKRNQGDAFKIIFLSRIEYAKGIYETLEAYKIAQERHPYISLTVAGDGTELEKVRLYSYHNAIPNVEYTGYIEGKRKIEALEKSHCYILPSHTEGLPISVLEAMAVGLPVITRPVGALKDFFEDGKMGFITESHDPVIFAEYIDQLINDPELCERIGRYNKEYARERFAASKVSKRLEDIFEIVRQKNR